MSIGEESNTDVLLRSIEALDGQRILVVGDVILDRYIWGDAARISPEAPVPVLRADAEEVRLGGAASVSLLAHSLGADVSLAGVIGDDADGRVLRSIVAESGLQDGFLVVDGDRRTTTKERIIGRAAGRHPHQIVRIDREDPVPIPRAAESRMLDAIKEHLDAFDAVLISDYDKGVCTAALLRQLIDTTRERRVPIVVDPARIADYRKYKGCTALTPNRVEAELFAGRSITTLADAVSVGELLCHRVEVNSAIVTLDRDGIVLAWADGADAQHIPTQPREVHDITGAGDMVLAVIGLGVAAGLPFECAARLANLAAGLEVERVGVVPVTPAELSSAVTGQRVPPPSRVATLDELAVLTESYRRESKQIAFTNGCFDLLHIGHVSYLREAAQFGDVLIVAVNSDRSVSQLKGPRRPIIGEQARARLLEALDCVDHVLIFDEDTPHRVLRAIRPDVLVKGGTYGPDEVVGREVVLGYGGRVQVTGEIRQTSTSAIISHIESQRHLRDTAKPYGAHQ